jgi:epoxide hydrolase-like predicted phosphatase
MEVPVEAKSEPGLPKIKAVVFDWGGVITVPPGPVIEKLYRHINVDQKQLRARRAEYRDDDPNSQFAKLERGEMSLESYLAWSRSDLPGAEVIWDPQSPHFLFAHLAVVPQVVDGISRLRERGFVTGLLTNNIVEAWPTVVDGLEVAKLFDVVINSAFVGMRKPEERIYAYLIEQLETEPENVLFLDDNRVNIDAARAFGLQAIEVKQPVEIWSEIEQVLEET